ncbi:MAG: hypothetical protein HY451_00130 [Parcubacteria group bacterium]|nr:hypothetical protein [Parcubacteria group bacterium]
MIEIKELIPKSKEVVIQPKAGGVFCDAFSYEINGKKYFYMVSQIQSGDPSLDYIPNLIATFIKRELEENPGQDQIFEKALKKTNELIEGLLKENNKVKFDFGVAFIDKEKVAVSKIGKAKMLAYRLKTGDVFDVFENAAQGSRSPATGKKFSNIVSGEIKKGDKFFFFIPNPGLNFKQKLISVSLAKSEQGSFLESINKVASPLNLSGIYLEIKEELKKVAKETGSKEASPRLSGAFGALSAPPEFSEKEPKEAPIVATEVAKVSRSDTLKRTTDKFREMIMGGDSDSANARKWKLIKTRGVNNYLIVAFIGLALVAGLVFLTKGNSKLKEALASINEKLKVSESRLLLKQNYEARKFLGEAVAELNTLEESEKKEKARLAATALMNRIEKVDESVKPAILKELSQYVNFNSNINLGDLKNILIGGGALSAPNAPLSGGGKIFVTDSVKVYEVKENELKPIEESGAFTLSWIKDNKIILYGTSVKIISLDSGKISELKKKFSFEPIEFKNYEDNLYFLGSKNIYKITNALLKPKEELEWLKPAEAGKISGNFAAFDLDSSVYALTDDRKLAVMFKGEVSKIIDLDFDVRPGAELINLGGKELLAIDKESKLARKINDAGELKASYDLSSIETIKDAFFDKESRTLYFLSPTRIWKLQI